MSIAEESVSKFAVQAMSITEEKHHQMKKFTALPPMPFLGVRHASRNAQVRPINVSAQSLDRWYLPSVAQRSRRYKVQLAPRKIQPLGRELGRSARTRSGGPDGQILPFCRPCSALIATVTGPVTATADNIRFDHDARQNVDHSFGLTTRSNRTCSEPHGVQARRPDMVRRTLARSDRTRFCCRSGLDIEKDFKL